MSLRYGSGIEPRPHARLSGWFERQLTFWRVQRWLELDGSTLTYRHRQHEDAVWTCDLREARMSAGRRACEIVLQRPGCEPVSLFAPSLDELKLWFGQMKSVSDSVYDFYHFSAKVGHTQNGVIYLGCDKKSQGDVAIHAEDKRNLPLHKMLILTKRDLSVVSATQSHECVVRVIDLFESTKRFYTVTELVSGGTLHDLLSRPLSETVARDVMADILHGLQHLHLHDVVHGNLDALHIMCSKRSLPCLVKIVAYGNAVARRDARLLGGTTSGFWQTLAPEVVCFQRRSAASDVFSAGSLLFRMLCGISPFATDHEAAYLACVSRGLAFEGKVWDGISEEARALVRNMLSDDASSRPTATQCLDCEWFRGGLADADGADLEDGLVRVASDPKTVIMDFEMARPMSRGPVGGAIRGSSANELEDLSYGKLEA